MQIITKNENNIYSVSIVTRSFSPIVNAKFRSKMSGKNEDFIFNATYKNNVMNIELPGFQPKENALFELVISCIENEIIWQGQVSYLQ